MREHGFLMLEVLFTSLLLTVIVAIAGLYLVGSHMVFTAKNLTTATCLAEKQLACVKGNGALWRNNGAIAWQDDSDTLPLIKNGMTFGVVTSLQSTGEDVDLKRVNVVISWQEYGKEQQIDVSALVYRDE